MSTSIEQRVVQMRFDNKQFESGVAQSMSTLDKLKAKLNFKGATQGFEDIQRAADKVNLQTIGDQADKVGIKFDALAVVAITALQRMTNAAINAGTSMVKGLSVDQITAGWTKYEQKTGSVQTIMNATGKSIDEVNKYLDKLMWFSDETSYGFNDMTAAIGQLTSAGGDIDKLVPMVMGIANATAFAGKGVNEFSRAIYNLNQSYSAGNLQYMDWKSLELAGIASKQLKEVFIQTAEEMGKVQKGAITIANFGETLKNKWADTEVMEKAFGKFGEMTEKAYEMVNSGMVETASEAYEILSQTYTGFSITAAKAAQEAKSFSEAVEATKDAVSSGWMKTFEIIFGNYEEAKKLWTDLANTMWEVFASGADARNEMLQEWKDLGGRTQLIYTFSRAWQNLYTVIETFKSAFRDIFPPVTAKQLYDMIYRLSVFVFNLQLSEEALNTLRVAFKALLLPVKAAVTIVEIGVYWIEKAIIRLVRLGDALFAIPSKVNPFEASLRKIFGDDRYERIAKALTTTVEKLGKAFSAVGDKISSTVKSANLFANGRLGQAFGRLIELLEPISEWILDRIVDGFEVLANFDYDRITDWAISAIDSLVIGFGLITEGCVTAISSIKDFFASFKDSTAIEIITKIVDGVASLKTNMMTFIKSLGFAQIMGSLKTEAMGIADVVSKLGEAVQSMVSKLTPAKILVFSFGASIVWMFTAIAKAFESVKKVGDGVTGVLGGATGVLKAMQQRLKGSKILQIAVAIGVLAISLGALSKIDPDRLQASAIALGSLMVILGVLVAGMAAVNKFLVGSETMAQNLLKVTTAMIMISGAVAAMAGALLLLSKIDMEGMWAKLGVLAVVMVALAAASIAVAKLAPELTKGAGFLLLFAISIGVIVNSLEKLANADLNGVEKNIVSLLVIMGMLAGLSAASRYVKFGSAAGLTLFILDILFFVNVLKKISDVDVASLSEGIALFTAMLLSLIPMAAVAKLAGKEMAGAGVMIASMSLSMLILAQAIKMIGALDPAEAFRGTIYVGFVLTLFAAILKVSQVAEKGSKVAQPSFLAMAASILLLAVAIDYLGKLELKRVVQGGIVVAAILSLFAVLTKVAGEAKGATGSIAAMSVALGLITASLMLLTLVPFEEVIKASAALSLALLALGGAMHLMNGLDLKTAMGSIIMLLSVILSIQYVMKALKDVDSDDVLKIAGSIGLILVSLGASMALLQSTMGKGNVANIGQTLFFMVGMLTTSAIIFSIVSAMPYSEGLLEKATGLSMVLLALAGAMKIVRITTAKPENVTKTLGMILGMLAMATAVFAILTYLPLGEGMIEKAIALSTILMVLSGATAILAALAPGLIAVGKSWSSALKGMGVIAVGLVGLTALVVLAGTVFSQIEGLEPILDAAEYGLTRIGTILGEFVGSIIGGLAGGVTSAFPIIGQNLADFAENVKPFLELEVNSSVVSSIGSLVSVIGMLSGASFVDGISRILTFGKGGLSNFGQTLKDFAPHFKAFCDQIQDIKPGPVNAAARAMEGIGAMLDAIPTEGGVFEFFTGTKNLKSFGEGLQQFAPGFVGYCNAIADAASISAAVGTTKNVAACIKTLADSIPSSGGLLQAFFGEKDMSKFGGQMVDFANGLQDFFKIITGQAPDSVAVDLDVVKNCANVSKVLGEFARTIPSAGGALQDFFGEKNIGTFGQQLKTFASGLMGFFTTIDQEKISDEAVDQAIKIGGAFRDFAETLPADNGFIQQFTGSRGLDEFGYDIKEYGQALLDFFTSFGEATITDSDIDLAKNAGMAFTEILNAMPRSEGFGKLFATLDASNFKTDIGNLGVGLFNYFQQVRQISFETIHESVEALKEVLSLNDFMGNFSEHSGDLAEYLSNLANSGIKGFIDAFDDVGDRFSNAITTAINNAFIQASTNLDLYSETYDVLIDALVAGINSNIDEILVKAQEICLKFVDSIEEEWEQLQSGGAFIVQSLIYGLDSSQSKLTDKVRELMVGVLNTVKASLGIKGQYSQKFAEAGESCISGLMKGFEKNRLALLTRVRTLGNDILTTFDETVGHHSPWTTTEERGETMVDGLDLGINNSESGLLDTVSNLGENVLGELSNALDVQNGVSLEGYDLGESLDLGIGTGLDESDYAYKAAATKADGILNIFKERFSNISDTMSVLDKEFEVWATMNPVSSYSDGVNSYSFGQGAYTEKQLELLQTKLSLQAEQVNMANASYQANLAKFGEGATATKEAYSTYLEAQLNMAQMAQSMQQLQAQNQQNFTSYAKMLGEVYDGMKQAGFSDEEIKKSVSDQTGWVRMRDAASGSINDIVNSYLQEASDVGELVTEAMETMKSTASSSGKQAGTSAMQSFGQGAQEASSDTAQSLAGTVKQTVQEAVKESDGAFNRSGASFIEGLIDGASSKVGDLYNALTGAGEKAEDGWKDQTETRSPSQVMYRNGVYFIEGLINGIDEMGPNAVDSATEVASSTLTVFTDVASEYPGVGQNMMLGLAEGISAGSSTVINAAVQVATRALAAAKEVLGIHSPSRVFYKIGQMIDQGLSNGILDEYAIVDGSISKIVNRMTDDDLTIRPVVDMGGLEPMEEWWEKYRGQLIAFDASGNIVPVSDNLAINYAMGKYTKGQKWTFVDKDTFSQISDILSETIEYEKMSDAAKATLWGLREAAMSGRFTEEAAKNAPTYSITQNITSPTPANPAEIARRTTNAAARLNQASENVIQNNVSLTTKMIAR